MNLQASLPNAISLRLRRFLSVLCLTMNRPSGSPAQIFAAGIAAGGSRLPRDWLWKTTWRQHRQGTVCCRPVAGFDDEVKYQPLRPVVQIELMAVIDVAAGVDHVGMRLE